MNKTRCQVINENAELLGSTEFMHHFVYYSKL